MHVCQPTCCVGVCAWYKRPAYSRIHTHACVPTNNKNDKKNIAAFLYQAVVAGLSNIRTILNKTQ